MRRSRRPTARRRRSPALPPANLPEGEQFAELLQWLEMGLTRLEIEAIKARGVGQLLQQVEEALAAACPPDLTEAAVRTRKAWAAPLAEEAAATTEVLLNTLEPYQAEIEHHFTVEGQRRFRGIMGGYLRLVNRSKYVGASLRDKVPFLPKARDGATTPASWDASRFARACSEIAANRQLDARGKALANRLLVEADAQGFALKVLADPVEAASKTDWRQRYALAMSEVLHQVEKQRTRADGAAPLRPGRARFPGGLGAARRLGLRDRSTSCSRRSTSGKETPRPSIGWLDLALPLFVTLAVLVILHVLIALLLPLRWSQIRGEFKVRLEKRLQQELENVYGPVPEDVAALLLAERRQVEKLAGETRDVASWLRQREQSASVAGLYGK